MSRTYESISPHDFKLGDIISHYGMRLRIATEPRETTIHPIDEASPLFGKSEDDLAATKAEFLILLSGTDETFNQVVHTRSSYEASEVIWNARFRSLYNPPDRDGSLSIDVGRLSAIERV